MKISHGICLAAIGAGLALVDATGSPAQTKDGASAPPVKPAGLTTDAVMLYATYCVRCHGKDGKGEGPMAPTLNVKVPDLTSLAARNGGVFPMARVEQDLSTKAPVSITHGGVVMWAAMFASAGTDPALEKVRAHNLALYLEAIQIPKGKP